MEVDGFSARAKASLLGHYLLCEEKVCRLGRKRVKLF